MLEAIGKEIITEKGFLEGEELETVYLGGGTPSILRAGEIKHLLNTIRENYNLSQQAEISLEANPDDINPGYLEQLRHAGINRLSIGIQSFQNEDLEFMNRRHDSARARACLEHTVKAGFENFSLDLIYGLPGMSKQKWKENLEIATEFKPVHMAAYHLDYEEGTVMDYRRRKKKFQPLDENTSLAHYTLLAEHMEARGFQHYEISNFALPGFISKHNSAYWKGRKYIGIGPSAHSFNGLVRRWNVAGNESYIRGIRNNIKVYDEELLDEKARYHDYLITSLRTMWGIDIDYLRKEWTAVYYEHILKQLPRFVKNGKISENNERLVLTREGMLIADHIIKELML